MSKLTTVVIDYECFWSSTYTLSKMTPIEYVNGSEYETQSCATKINNEETIITFGHADTAKLHGTIDWTKAALIAHNGSEFDFLISSKHFGIDPKLYCCTLAMARGAGHAKTVGGSLKALAEHYGLQAKGSLEATNTKGLRLADFTPEMRAAMREYNKIDTDIAYELFKILRKQTSTDEMRLIDRTIRMLVEPRFECDVDLLRRGLKAERKRKERLLTRLSDKLGVEHDEEAIRKTCASAPKFKALLESLGVEVPTKVSPTTGKEIPALAKTDQAMSDLQEHPDDVVQAAAMARLGVRSTILETRIERMITFAECYGGKMPVPLRYYGADTTGRWSGTMSVNLQNLPRVGKKAQISDVLRRSLRAPEGHKVVVADLSGIELRVNHFLWWEPGSMERFQADRKADLYKAFAAKLFNKPESDITKDERQLAKLCVAEGTLVLTDHGEIPIERVTTSHKLWDGVTWVTHDGAVCNGEREVITHDGVTATPDHEVFTRCGRKVPIGQAKREALRLVCTGVGGAPVGALEALGQGVQEEPAWGPTAVLSVPDLRHDEVGTLRQPAGWEVDGVPSVRAQNGAARSTGGAKMADSADGVSSVQVSATDGRRVPQVWREGSGVQVPDISRSCGMGDGESRTRQVEGNRQDRQQRALRTGEPPLGEPETEHGQSAEQPLQGVSRVPTVTPGDSIRGQHVEKPTVRWDDGRRDRGEVSQEVGQTKRRVWDILNAGPRHRFTANGKLVSNCQLGLGYGVGWKKFKDVARLMGGIELSDDEAKRVTYAWRDTYQQITTGWKRCDIALDVIYDGGKLFHIDPWELCTATKQGIKTPKGAIYYHGLHREGNEWWYGKGRSRARIYGPKVVENLVQHLSRHVMTDAMLSFERENISKHCPMVHTVHDEVILVAPDSLAEEALDILQDKLRTPPTWWPELITYSEGGIAQDYGSVEK